MLVASDGRLWIGTSKGVNVFNGKHFESIELTGAKERFVTNIAEDEHGNIYFICLDNVIYRVDGLEAKRHPASDVLEMHHHGGIPHKLYSLGDSITVSTTRGVISITRDTFSNHTQWTSPRQKGEFVTVNGKLLGCVTGFFQGYEEIPITFFDRALFFRDTIPNRHWSHAYAANTGSCFAIGLAKRLIYYDGHDMKSLHLSHASTNSLFMENDSILWVGTEGGGVYKIVNGNIDKILFSGKSIYWIAKDFEGGYWFGTGTEGVLYVPWEDARIQMVDGKVLKVLQLNGHQHRLTGLTTDYRVFRGQRLSQPFLSNDTIGSPRLDVLDSSSITSFAFTSSEGGHSVVLINWGNDWGKEVELLKGQIGVGIKFRLYKGDTILCKYHELSYQGQSRSVLFPRDPDFRFIRTKRIIPSKRKDAFWIVHRGGISLFQTLPEQDSAYVIRTLDSLEGHLDLFELNDAWILPNIDRYLYHLDTLSGRYSKLESIGVHEVLCFFTISPSQVILGTVDGLVLLSSAGENIEAGITARNLSHEFGLPKRLIRDIEVIGDTLFFASESEIGALPISCINTSAPEKGTFHIGGIQVSGSSVSSPIKQKIYTDDQLMVQLETIGFKDRSRYGLFFRLPPLYPDWQEVTSGQLIFYSLPAREYRLELKDIYDRSLALPFEIHEYFYQTNWFLSLVVLVLAAILASPFYLSNKLNMARSKLENEKNMLRLSSLTSQLKPHFVFNALSSIQSFILVRTSRESSEYLSKFAMHIRHALEQSNSNRISLGHSLEIIANYLDLERMRLDGNFTYNIRIEPDIDVKSIMIPVMLLQPYVENAVLHGMVSLEQGGLIEIRVFKDLQGCIKCTIADNGKGLGNSVQIGSKPPSGLGTKINAERLQLLNAMSEDSYKAEVRDHPGGRGVLVTIQIELAGGKD